MKSNDKFSIYNNYAILQCFTSEMTHTGEVVPVGVCTQSLTFKKLLS